MKLDEINPFLRFSGHLFKKGISEYTKALCACDHRLFVVECGAICIEANGKKYAMQRGSILFVRSGVEYRYLSVSEDLSLFSFNFDLTRRNASSAIPIPPENADVRRRAAFEGEECRIEELADALYALDGEAPTIAARIEREYRHGALLYEVGCGHMLAELLVLAVRGALRCDMPKSARLVREITGYIREHYAEDCSNEKISEVFSYHPSYISRLMVEHTGMSLHQYVSRTRIGYALGLLEGGLYSVTEVASMVGFSDLVHFSKTFRKQIGKSPSAYRSHK